MEEARGERGAGEGEAAAGVEEQEQHPEAVHHEGAPARQDDLRRQVGGENTLNSCFHLLFLKNMFFSYEH